MRRLDQISKDEIVRLILETSQAAAEGYRQNHCEHCQDGATAASNTGSFILNSLGFSYDEIRAMVAALPRPLGRIAL